MGSGNLKVIFSVISTAFTSLIYTKKRIRKENRLKALHAKVNK
jgi:hypothetical protein